ncbi:hypothetical protein SPRG_17711, partial [Saprolegnia parasitica CBS 223.65]
MRSERVIPLASSRLSETDVETDENDALTHEPDDATKSLVHLVFEDKLDLVRERLRQGNLDSDELTEEFEGENILHWAIANGHDEIVALLLQQPAIQTISDAGKTPLHAACRTQNFGGIVILLDAGADASAVDS